MMDVRISEGIKHTLNSEQFLILYSIRTIFSEMQSAFCYEIEMHGNNSDYFIKYCLPSVLFVSEGIHPLVEKINHIFGVYPAPPYPDPKTLVFSSIDYPQATLTMHYRDENPGKLIIRERHVGIIGDIGDTNFFMCTEPTVYFPSGTTYLTRGVRTSIKMELKDIRECQPDDLIEYLL